MNSFLDILKSKADAVKKENLAKIQELEETFDLRDVLTNDEWKLKRPFGISDEWLIKGDELTSDNVIKDPDKIAKWKVLKEFAIEQLKDPAQDISFVESVYNDIYWEVISDVRNKHESLDKEKVDFLDKVGLSIMGSKKETRDGSWCFHENTNVFEKYEKKYHGSDYTIEEFKDDALGNKYKQVLEIFDTLKSNATKQAQNLIDFYKKDYDAHLKSITASKNLVNDFKKPSNDEMKNTLSSKAQKEPVNSQRRKLKVRL